MPFKPSPNERASHMWPEIPVWALAALCQLAPKPHTRVRFCSSSGFAGLVFVFSSRGRHRRRRPFFPDQLLVRRTACRAADFTGEAA